MLTEPPTKQMNGKATCGLHIQSLPHSLAAKCKAVAPNSSKIKMRRLFFLSLCVCGMQMKLADQHTMQVDTSKATHKLHKQQICQQEDANQLTV